MEIKQICLQQLRDICQSSPASVLLTDQTFHIVEYSGSALTLALSLGDDLPALLSEQSLATIPCFIPSLQGRAALLIPFSLVEGPYFMIGFLSGEEESTALSRQQQSLVLSDLSHELNHPLNVLLSGLQMLRRSLPQELSPTQNQLLLSMDQSARDLYDISQNLATVSRIYLEEDGAYTQTCEVDLVSLLREHCIRMDLLLTPQGCHVELCTSLEHLYTSTSPFLLERVVANLVYNAVHHAHCQHIRVLLEQQEETASITVADNGPGIPPDDLQRLLMRFQRGPAESHQPGQGVGLAIVQTYTHYLGGHISVHSTPEEGCLFTISLPIRTAENSGILALRDFAYSEALLRSLLF
ncbi:MAG: sensor histidine kinase [Eubacteriales bacterium]